MPLGTPRSNNTVANGADVSQSCPSTRIASNLLETLQVMGMSLTRSAVAGIAFETRAGPNSMAGGRCMHGLEKSPTPGERRAVFRCLDRHATRHASTGAMAADKPDS